MIRVIVLFTALALTGFAATFRDIAPILESHCAGCHQAGEIGPMPLTTYAQARPWAKAIKQAVMQGTMPPWHADRVTSERFANSRLLKESEIRMIAEWADGGAAEGTPGASIRPAHAGHEGWKLGKPDLIIKVPGAKVPASGTFEYTFLVTPVDIPADTWIAAAEWKIDQRAVVHHMNAFLRPAGSAYVANAPPGVLYVASREERARRPQEREVDRRELLVGYEPGYKPAPWGEGRAKLLRKGSSVVFEIHYNPNGKALEDFSELGIYFAKEAPRERVLTIVPADAAGLEIPAGAADYSSHLTATMTHDVTLVSLQPHMHLRGKAFEIAAVYPDGKREWLLRVPHYDFNWQTTYFLAMPMRLPKGTVLEYTATFDNSPNNRANPDPTKTVYWGDQSWEEMNIGFTELAFEVSADPDVAVLSGTTKPGSVTPKH